MEGMGKMLVISVGVDTQSGRIMSMLDNIVENGNGQSLLQLKLTKLAVYIGYIGNFNKYYYSA